MVSSITLGPEEQFSPITSTGHSFNRCVKVRGGRSVAQRAIVFDAELRHDDHVVPGNFAGGQNGFSNFVRIAKRFEHQQIDSGFHQSFDLFAEHSARFGEAGGAQRLQANS